MGDAIPEVRNKASVQNECKKSGEKVSDDTGGISVNFEDIKALPRGLQMSHVANGLLTMTEVEKDDKLFFEHGCRSSTKTKYVGVYTNGKKGYKAQFHALGQKFYMGTFPTAKEAARAYNLVAEKHGKETNIISSGSEDGDDLLDVTVVQSPKIPASCLNKSPKSGRKRKKSSSTSSETSKRIRKNRARKSSMGFAPGLSDDRRAIVRLARVLATRGSRSAVMSLRRILSPENLMSVLSESELIKLVFGSESMGHAGGAGETKGVERNHMIINSFEKTDSETRNPVSSNINPGSTREEAGRDRDEAEASCGREGETKGKAVGEGNRGVGCSDRMQRNRGQGDLGMQIREQEGSLRDGEPPSIHLPQGLESDFDQLMHTLRSVSFQEDVDILEEYLIDTSLQDTVNLEDKITECTNHSTSRISDDSYDIEYVMAQLSLKELRSQARRLGVTTKNSNKRKLAERIMIRLDSIFSVPADDPSAPKYSLLKPKPSELEAMNHEDRRVTSGGADAKQAKGSRERIPEKSAKKPPSKSKGRTKGTRIKKPKTAFNFFQKEINGKVSEELRAQGIAGAKELNHATARRIADMWRAMGEEEREPYQIKSRADKVLYQRLLQQAAEKTCSEGRQSEMSLNDSKAKDVRKGKRHQRGKVEDVRKGKRQQRGKVEEKVEETAKKIRRKKKSKKRKSSSTKPKFPSKPEAQLQPPTTPPPRHLSPLKPQLQPERQPERQRQPLPQNRINAMHIEQKHSEDFIPRSQHAPYTVQLGQNGARTNDRRALMYHSGYSEVFSPRREDRRQSGEGRMREQHPVYHPGILHHHNPLYQSGIQPIHFHGASGMQREQLSRAMRAHVPGRTVEGLGSALDYRVRIGFGFTGFRSGLFWYR
ncbi:hypothetical protein AAMO2058_001363800 [Amorphochlora amoebiformis]